MVITTYRYYYKRGGVAIKEEISTCLASVTGRRLQSVYSRRSGRVICRDQAGRRPREKRTGVVVCPYFPLQDQRFFRECASKELSWLAAVKRRLRRAGSTLSKAVQKHTRRLVRIVRPAKGV